MFMCRYRYAKGATKVNRIVGQNDDLWVACSLRAADEERRGRFGGGEQFG
jgi:hypothetical protein